MADIQTKRAYQKQPTIFQNKKRVGSCLGKPEIPFTGNVSIGRSILSGVVTKMKMQRTTVICQDYLHYI
ncbi:40S ribosomal protein S11 [Galemys pyrenaicus]|uniref:40S ribosomal protein S11 n=1 Tax=Galemys pyrenaicus TaxID=202257 RepID=A0A8J6AH58_GALPY|nr:40S ribosomal protein S11 [Galemys pyrenaicus]